MAAFDQANRRKLYFLDFEKYGGLTVCTRKQSFRGVELLQHATSVLGETMEGTGAPIAERVEAWGSLIRAFADALVRWDLRDGNVAVPPTLDGVFSQDLEFLLDLALMWYRRVVLHADPGPPPARAEAPAEDDEPEDDLEAELAALPVTSLPVPVPG